MGDDAQWSVDHVVAGPDGVEILVRVGAAEGRRTVAHVLQAGTARHLRLAGFLPRRARAPWDPDAWCGVVSRHRALLVLRARLESRARHTLAS